MKCIRDLVPYSFFRLYKVRNLKICCQDDPQWQILPTEFCENGKTCVKALGGAIHHASCHKAVFPSRNQSKKEYNV